MQFLNEPDYAFGLILHTNIKYIRNGDSVAQTPIEYISSSTIINDGSYHLLIIKYDKWQSMNLPVLSSEGNLAFYLQEIKKFPILSAAEEFMLAKTRLLSLLS